MFSRDAKAAVAERAHCQFIFDAESKKTTIDGTSHCTLNRA